MSDSNVTTQIEDKTIFDGVNDAKELRQKLKNINLDVDQASIILDECSKRFKINDTFNIYRHMNVVFPLIIDDARKVFNSKVSDRLYSFLSSLMQDNLELREENNKLKEQISQLKSNTDNNQAINNSQHIEDLSKTKDSIKDLERQKLDLIQDITDLTEEKVTIKLTIQKMIDALATYEGNNETKEKTKIILKPSEAMTLYNLNSFASVYSYFDDLSKRNEKNAIAIACKIGLSEVRDEKTLDTIFIEACVRGNYLLVKNLLEGKCDIDALNKFGNNALLEASAKGFTTIVKTLINAGFDKDFVKPSSGFNAILYASNHGHLETVKYLQSIGCDINSKNSQNATCTYFAAMSGHVEVVKFLHKSGADLNMRTTKGWLPLHAAAGNGCVKLIKYFVKNGCNKDEKTFTKKCPIHVAAEEGRIEAVKYLISIHCLLNEKDHKDKTPLDYCTDKDDPSHNKIAKLLTKQISKDQKNDSEHSSSN